MLGSHVWPIAALLLLLLALTWWDIRDTILPDGLNFALGALGLVVVVVDPIWVVGILNAAIGLLVGLVASYLVRWIAFKVYKQEAMGLGDVKFFAAAGVWVGAEGLATVALLGSFITLVFIVLYGLIKNQKISLAAAVPFGPGLCLGLFITVLAGPLHSWF